VGLFAHWVVVKGSPDALREAGFGEIVESETSGWLIGYPAEDADLPGWRAFDEAIAGIAAAANGPALGAWIYDSDVGYLAAADESGVAIRCVINADVARDPYGAELPDDWAEAAAVGIAAWSRRAPKTLEPSVVAELISREWSPAEEGVEEMHERLGLAVPYEAAPAETPARGPAPATVDTIGAAALGGYTGPLPWMTEGFRVGGRLVQWREARYVPGVGEDFIGIWDRESPDEPIARFRRSGRGESEAMHELHRLQEPLRRAKVRGDELAGFEQPLDVGHTFRLIQRELPWSEARYVAGHGRDFIGIWDREQPGEPIERFPASESGLTGAYSAVSRLLFEDVLPRKELSGIRFYLPRTERRFIQYDVTPGMFDRVQGLTPKQRAEWEERLKRGGFGVITPFGPWLLTEEEEDEKWPPTVDFGGRFFLYVHGLSGDETADELGFLCQGNFPTEDEAREAAIRLHAEGEWLPVPQDVPSNLLDTVRWLLANE
jgi:hypothetical protein